MDSWNRLRKSDARSERRSIRGWLWEREDRDEVSGIAPKGCLGKDSDFGRWAGEIVLQRIWYEADSD